MTLYRRPSTVGPDHFVIVHKESVGRELAIGFIHNPTRTNLTTLGACRCHDQRDHYATSGFAVEAG